MRTSTVLCFLPVLAVSIAPLQGAGVSVGASSLISILDYSDTFTQTDQGGRPDRPSTAAAQGAPAYVVENTYGKPSVSFGPVGAFSFASDGAGLVDGTPKYPGGSGAGSLLGITQTGGGVDYGLPYGLRGNYLVQVDAVQVGDRIDISSGAAVGIFSANSLSVFFRGSGGGASLFNGTTDTAIPGINTGITAGQWYNYGVRYDMTGKRLELYVNQASVGVVDLSTFAGGIYANFSNAFVGAGAGLGAGEDRTWTDNFQVGAPVPEASGALLTLVGFAGMSLRRKRRA
ncbi:MAG: hypothetical protein V4726_13120 [Verrucomicrobiota bacterium]